MAKDVYIRDTTENYQRIRTREIPATTHTLPPGLAGQKYGPLLLKK
jgi:hypothetical protein